MKLRDAGYRERVFAKAELIRQGRLKEWPAALDWNYDPNRDRIEGIGPVGLEGSDSKAILERHGLTHDDCLAGGIT